MDVLSTHQPRAFVVTETHLPLANEYILPQYTFSIPAVRASCRGPWIAGTAMFIHPGTKASFKYSLTPPADVHPGMYQVLCVNIEQEIDLVGIYVSPQANKATLTSILQQIRHRASGPTVILGDLNARHQSWCHGKNSRGQALTMWCSKTPFNGTAPPQPTFYSHNRQTGYSTIDIAISNIPNVSATVTKGDWDGVSDHIPVLIKMPVSSCPNKALIPQRRVTKTVLANPRHHEFVKSR